MKTAVNISLTSFALVYLLLIIVLAVMKKAKIDRTKLLIIASLRMTIQLIIAGLILTYILKNPHPIYTLAYFVLMSIFAVYRVLNQHQDLPRGFKIAIAASMVGAGFFTVVFFILVVTRQSIFDAQYMIPVSGMVMGNAMTGNNLAIKTFTESLDGQRPRIEALLAMGAKPQKVLLPFVNRAMETALLPTLNSMLGMGIVALPGMMTGQILSGTVPTTAILYQIAIMISITTVVCLSVFGALYYGHRSFITPRQQILLPSKADEKE